MKENILCTATVCVLCVVSVHILQYINAQHGLSYASKVAYQPLCKSFSHTSLYNISTDVVSWETIENEIKNLEHGGRFAPRGCTSQWRVAIIVPYRDRENHLKVFLRHIHPFLQQHQLEYGIFVIEMPPITSFNRGLLMNVGFIESCRLYNYNCFIFHDVDLLPENTRNFYNCTENPTQLSSAIDSRNYKLPYANNFGGVTAIAKDQFVAINGFSNAYFGWGKEDDDLYHRVLNANLTIRRLSPDIGRYKDLRHEHGIRGAKNVKLFENRQLRYLSDGLSNLAYQKIQFKLRYLYSWISIGIKDQTYQK